MFDWFSKAFIEWNFIDVIIIYLSIGLISFILILCGVCLMIIKDKIKEKIERKRK